MNNTPEFNWICVHSKGEWNRVGLMIHAFPRFDYRVKISDGCGLHEVLGAVGQRADGRWNWWRWKSHFHKDWSGLKQGVSPSPEQAVAKVGEGWRCKEPGIKSAK
jgi:hypothetical protein